MLQNFTRSASLTAKMVVTTVLAGIGVWGILDIIQTQDLKKTFLAHHQQDYERNERLDRIQLDRHIRRLPELVELVATRQGIQEYLEQVAPTWTEQAIHHTSPPPWLPSNTLLRSYPTPHLWMLLDAQHQVREISSTLHGKLPQSLANPSPLLISLSANQHYITLLDDQPFIISSRELAYHKDNRHATLLLATPIDDEFLSLLKYSKQDSSGIVVMIDSHRNDLIIGSSTPDSVPTQTLLGEYLDDYVLVGLQKLDYGDSEIMIKFGSLFSRREIKHIMTEVMKEERWARLILGLSLIISFLMVMVSLTRRISFLNHKVAEFALKELGEPLEPRLVGDQLVILEERFNNLSRQVKATHRTLLDNACELATVLENVADGIIIIDEEGAVTSMNPAAFEIFLPVVPPPFPLEQIIPEKSYLHHWQEFQRFSETTDASLPSHPMELPILRPDGSVRLLDMRISTMHWQEHHHTIGIVRDITERKRAELALKASEERFRTLVELLPHGVEECTTEGVITFANPARHRLLEMAPGQMIGKNIFDFSDGIGSELTKKYFALLLEEQPSPTPYFEQNRTTSGKIIDIQVDWTYKRDSQRGVIGFVSIITDITEKKSAERRIREQQEALAHVQRLQTMGEIASGIAHELNQPLAAILNYSRGCSRRLRSGSWDFQEILAVIDRIGEQAERVGSVMQNLRGFLSKGKVNTTRVELTQVVQDAVEFMDYETRRHGVAVRFRTDDQEHPVIADTIQIQQVIQNLMRNAIDAMVESEHELRVLDINIFANTDNRVTLTIEDSGTGVDPRIKSELFCPFFTTKPDGMGLGLSISQSIIEHHGGKLWFENGQQGGAIFGIHLPMGRRSLL